MTDTQKIEVLKEYLWLMRREYGIQIAENNQYKNAQQWLAYLEVGNDGWIKVSDRLPEFNTPTLWYYPDKLTMVWSLYPDDDLHSMNKMPTHWQPIQPPKE